MHVRCNGLRRREGFGLIGRRRRNIGESPRPSIPAEMTQKCSRGSIGAITARRKASNQATAGRHCTRRANPHDVATADRRPAQSAKPAQSAEPGGRLLRLATRAARLLGVTESRATSPKTTAKPTAKPAVARARKAAGPAAPPAVRASKPATPAYRHPNLGLAPVDMTAGFPAAAQKVREDAATIAAGALEAAIKADPTIRTRYDQVALRRLLRDGELLADRLATCLASGKDRYLTDYAEWIGPICRRRGLSLGDLAAVCAGICDALGPTLSPDELAAATSSLEAAAVVFKRNGRLAGDSHKRNALLKWMYRGV